MEDVDNGGDYACPKVHEKSLDLLITLVVNLKLL